MSWMVFPVGLGKLSAFARANQQHNHPGIFIFYF